MSTTVGAVKTALVALLEATFAGDAAPVTVFDGPRGAKTFSEDRIALVLDVAGTSGADALDLGTQGETYTVQVRLAVRMTGADSLQAARDAVLDLWQRAELAVREHPTGDLGLSASGVLGVRVAPQFELTEVADAEGREAGVRWGVYVIGQRQ